MSESERIYTENLEALSKTFSNQEVVSSTEKIIAVMVEALKDGKKILLCGNGGSAADCQHIAAEFIGRFKLERKSLPAIALTTDTSALTCLSNDYSFEDVFRRQVEGLGVEGDILFGISTSGNSENVIRAVNFAKEQGLVTVSLTGGSGGKLKGLTDYNVNIDSDYTPYIQSGHCVAYHAICEVVEKQMAQHLGG